MAHRSIKGIEHTLALMKRADNRWADKYVLDVSHLLLKLKEAEKEVSELRATVLRLTQEPYDADDDKPST